ncbi:hypothetical protein [Marinimicrobium agarilyticum]|uniref:hypothetical protein n=1 Tax=Marinimicrobium agarilyticum TaxID=306546 RepID=UPI00041C2D02|nr:hypothetical protein [Marinimicrobium agarilyticum]
MEKEIKRRLLKRKFSSVEYMEEMRDWHQKAIDGLLEGLRNFYRFPPQNEDWHNWHPSDWPETWEKKVLTNLRDIQNSIDDGIVRAKNGDSSYIDSVAAEIHSIFRNMDVVSWKWWEYINSEYRKRFDDSLVMASKTASNIMRELSDAWKTEESILKEAITGPVDERDLKRYLRPGEKA